MTEEAATRKGARPVHPSPDFYSWQTGGEDTCGLVSLATPVYNSMPYLEGYLDSVVAQTWRPLQLILVDDGSTDGSVGHVESRIGELEDAGVDVVFLKQEHAGQAAAMNTALPRVEGEFFTWCDADDVLSPESVEVKVRWLRDNPEYGMVRTNGSVVDAATGKLLGESAKEEDKHDQDIFEALLLDRTYCYAGCYMIRSDVFFEGYPDRVIPASPEGQNMQLLLPSASRTHCGYIDDRLHTYMRHPDSHSSHERSYSQNLARIKNFTVMKTEVLAACDCDFEAFRQKLADLEAYNMRALLESAAVRARKEMK